MRFPMQLLKVSLDSVVCHHTSPVHKGAIILGWGLAPLVHIHLVTSIKNCLQTRSYSSMLRVRSPNSEFQEDIGQPTAQSSGVISLLLHHTDI